MPLDVTWSPPGQRKRGTPKAKRWALLAVLLLANLAVVMYHGDPRDRLDTPTRQDKSSKEREDRAARNAADETATEVGDSGALASWPATEEEPSPNAVLGSALDPLAGVRTPGPVQRIETARLGRNRTLGQVLDAAGLDGEEAAELLGSLAPLVNFRHLRPSDLIKTRFDRNDRLIALDIHKGPLDEVRAALSGQGWKARRVEISVGSVLAVVGGRVETSLWDAMVSQQERPVLALELADIFAWEIDFYSEVYPGDTFRLLVPKRQVDGQLVGYGQIQAAEFVSADVVHRAFVFTHENGKVSYYDAEGRSLRKQLLRSPLKYGHVTSGFGRRRHPVLGYSRQHNGVDYGVPRGTPVWSVGDGRILRAEWVGGYGKLVEIRHANGWVSQYAHLSRIKVRRRQRVIQKQVIGASGNTGLSTGPHLHYGLKQAGRFVNPARQQFERGKPLRGHDKQRFLENVPELLRQLQAVQVARQGQREEAQEG